MNLNERVLEGELMDAPDLAVNLHESALRGLQRVNRFSGTARVLAGCIYERFRSVDRPLRILDLACGGGDVTISLSQQLARLGLQASVEGWDRSDTAIAYAKEHGRGTSTSFHPYDFADLNVDSQYDVVMCTLFLHHLDRVQALDLLARMFRASRGIVLVDDLRRTWLGYRLAQLGCQLLSRSRIVHVDGPLSVRAAFTEPEVKELSVQAGLPEPQITRHWPQRFLACWQRTATS